MKLIFSYLKFLKVVLDKTNHDFLTSIFIVKDYVSVSKQDWLAGAWIKNEFGTDKLPHFIK
ncbi:hypothetical protein BpHYR1_034686 [Brachionus plicatilis]|uniref:Uncharacterized protein n=1 Tax=Brachionus plicatilis TaxID=10195 RepID=A0A3M7SH57_BRAPC|nr:hypothetical protein BpHYR1_034686 [Brachionus plicatilis]